MSSSPRQQVDDTCGGGDGNGGQDKNASLRKYYESAIKPIHHNRDSLFHSSSGFINYRGFINLCYIILVLSNFRVALENVLKYGILFDPLRWQYKFLSIPNLTPLFLLLLVLNIFILISFLLERYLAKFETTPSIYSTPFIVLLLLLLISIPVWVFSNYRINPIVASVCCTGYSIVFLKLISYHMTNYWYRQKIALLLFSNHHHLNGNSHHHTSNDVNEKIHTPVVAYPDNLTIGHLYYFMFAPTLCYELNFPRSPRIRKRFVIKRTLEIILLLQLEIGLIQQWMVPTIQNSLEPFMQMSLTTMLERLLKLAIPNHLIWLIFFYLYFHSTLNLVAELIRFGDREFYRDWWNSESIAYFWRTWNVPVYRWCLRHLFLPLLSYNIDNQTASMIVFLVSAFFHEYFVSVPLNMYRLWAFTGMIVQVPLDMVVKRLNKNVANYAVWLSLIIGQPLCIMMYYHDFYVMHVANTAATAVSGSSQSII